MRLPSKRRKRIIALCLLADHIPSEQEYSERQFNELLNTLHTFSDPATLRRELFDYYQIDREKDGSRYRLNSERPDAETLIEKYCT